MTAAAWNLPGPPGFQGLRTDVPLTIYDRHLPHWRQDGATYFVTFRLADSLPQSKLRELTSWQREFAARYGITGSDGKLPQLLRGDVIPQSAYDAFSRERIRRVEKWLDRGWGRCHLRRPEISGIVVDALHFLDGDQYELGTYVVMPNHVHFVTRPLHPATHPLEKTLQGRKLWSSREINMRLGRAGQLWHEESFDRIIRDEEHLWQCVQYVGDNPRRAGLLPDACPRWIRPSWEAMVWSWSSMRAITRLSRCWGERTNSPACWRIRVWRCPR